jgi:CHASE3 domain sensor protein
MAEDNLALAANEKTLPQKSARPVSLTPVLLGFFFIAVIAVAAFLTQRGVNNSTNWVLHTYDVRGELQNLHTQLAEIRGSALAYGGSGDGTELQLFRQHSDDIEKAFEHLGKLTADNARQQGRLSKLESLSRNYVAQLQGVMAPDVQSNSASPAKSAAIRELDSQQLGVERVVRRMDEEEISLLSQRFGTWNLEFWRTSVVLTLALFAALGFLAYNFRLLSREIVRTRDLELVACTQRPYSRSSGCRAAQNRPGIARQRRAISGGPENQSGADTNHSREFVFDARKAIVRNHSSDRAFHGGSKDHFTSAASPAVG